MDLTIVALYTICDDLLISIGHQEQPQAKRSDAKVMTAALVAARYFGDNQQTTCAVLKTIGYIPNMLGHSSFNRRLHRIPQLFPKSIHAVSAAGFELKVLLFVIATSIKQLFGQR